jgi:predicted enzyme related to lactoylglutathione lyase
MPAAPHNPVPVASSSTSSRPSAAPPSWQSPTKRPAHQIVWFDIPVRDLERAVRFYSAMLGAPVEMVQAAFGTPTIALLPHAEGAITGSLVASMDPNVAEGGPLIYLSAQGRLDEAVAAAQMNGGKIVHAKQSFGSAGWRAVILDSEGNRIALHST